MKFVKTIWKKQHSRVWFIVTCALVVLLAVVTVLSATVFFETFSSVLGGKRPVFADGIESVYLPDYESKEDTLEAANAFNEKICEEGFVLLRNENDVLPLKTPVSDESVSVRPKISVFGKNSVNFVYGGSGSGGGGGGEGASDLYDSLTAAGYDVNPALREFYENDGASGPSRPAKPENSNLDDGKTVTVPTYETPLSRYNGGVAGYIGEYTDAAIVVVSRMGGEGFDLPRSMKGAEGAASEDDHYLRLDANERALLEAVRSAFAGKPLILIVNAGTSMELGFMDEEKYGVDAAVWTGVPGNTGIMALGRILNGEVNPSGRTTDTFAADFTKDPTWSNFGDNLVTADPENDVLWGDQYGTADGDGTLTAQPYYFVDYEESVYVGYRYYETRGVTDGEEWYDANVIYPFGYGLDYTDFTWTVDASQISGKTIEPDGKYEITVTVRNDGDVAGRDVVQLYAHAPYTDGGIEKPETVLVDFEKTGPIAPGGEEEVTLTFDPYYLASFDCYDVNDNGCSGYELEAGSGYALYVSENAHDRSRPIPFSSPAARYEKDPVTGNAVSARYTDCENGYFDADTQLSDVTVDGKTRKGLSRSDWEGTWPSVRADGSADAAFIAALEDKTHNNPSDFDSMEMPWFDEPAEIMFRDMVTNADGVYAFAEGTPESEKYLPFVAYDDARWNTLLEQCGTDQLLNMFNYGAFKSAEIEKIGKPLTNDTDGPAGFVNFMLTDGTYWGTCYYASQMTVASTWSEEIAEEFGRMVGNEGIWGADGRGNGMPYSGWYAPGANIHRSPFGGRNFEYMSEDGLLTGKMAAAQIRGCQSKGVYCFIKHFALNDQETHRSNNGVCVWTTEQAMREIYLRPFEIAVKEGGTRAIMSSFNRIGTRWTGGDYRLLTEILRNEWGFRGTVICDFNSGAYMDPRQMAYAGGDLNLNNRNNLAWNDFDAGSTADAVVLRDCAKNVFYTVINSNAMNAEIVDYSLPYWTIILIIVDCAVAVGLAVWGVFAVRGALKGGKPALFAEDDDTAE